MRPFIANLVTASLLCLIIRHS